MPLLLQRLLAQQLVLQLDIMVVTLIILLCGVTALMAFPYILLALAIVAALGPGLLNALIAVAIVNIPFFARNIRGVTIA